MLPISYHTQLEAVKLERGKPHTCYAPASARPRQRPAQILFHRPPFRIPVTPQEDLPASGLKDQLRRKGLPLDVVFSARV